MTESFVLGRRLIWRRGAEPKIRSQMWKKISAIKNCTQVAEVLKIGTKNKNKDPLFTKKHFEKSACPEISINDKFRLEKCY